MQRADGKGVYDQMVARDLITPIPEIIDRARFEVHIATRLGVAITELENVAPIYVTAARIDIEIDAIHAEKRRAAQEKAARTAQRRRK